MNEGLPIGEAIAIEAKPKRQRIVLMQTMFIDLTECYCYRRKDERERFSASWRSVSKKD